MINAGKLKELVTIYRYTDAVDTTLGTNEKTPSAVATIHASVQPRTGSLLMGREAGTMLAKTTHVVIARSAAVKDMVNSDYLVWTDSNGKNHRFDIDYILPPDESRHTMVYVEEVIYNDCRL